MNFKHLIVALIWLACGVIGLCAAFFSPWAAVAFIAGVFWQICWNGI
jgi:hypothetical protein